MNMDPTNHKNGIMMAVCRLKHDKNFYEITKSRFVSKSTSHKTSKAKPFQVITCTKFNL